MSDGELDPNELDQLAHLALRYAESKRLSDRQVFSAANLAGAVAAEDSRRIEGPKLSGPNA